MSVTAAQLLVKVSAEGVAKTKDELAGVGKEAGDAGDKTGGFLSTLGAFVGGAAIVNVAGDAFNFLKGQVVDSFHAGMDANAVLAQTVAGLKSTHDASGQTAQSIGDLATHISNLSGIDDDAVQTAENMLLTFTGIGKNVFPQATQAAADMATKMNGGMIPSAQQMQQQALLLGKALNDPLKGITALQREGVTFTAQQKAQIAAMEKAGNTAGAQKIILGELNKEFGGSAAAAGQANGGIAILTAKFNNMKEQLGQQLIPIMGKLLDLIQPIANNLMNGLGGAISGITPLFNSLQAAFSNNTAIRQLGVMFGILEATIKTTAQQVGTAALPVLKQLGDFFNQHLLPAVNQFVGFAASTLVPMFGQIATFILQNVVPAVIQLGGFVTDTLLPAIEQMVGWFREHVLPVLEQVVKIVITDVLPVVENLAKVFIQKVVPALEHLWNVIAPLLIPALNAIGWVIKNVVGPVLGWLLGKIGDLINGIADFIGSIESNFTKGIKAVGDFFNNLGTKIHDLITKFQTAGHDLIQGLIDGVTKMFGPAVKAMSDLGGKMLHGVKSIFGIKSPSTVFADIGKNLSQGLINGVTGMDVAGPIGKHLAGAIPSLSGALNVGGGAGSGLSLIGRAPTYAGVGAAGAQSGGAGGAVGAGGGAPIVLVLDGRAVARGILPHLTSEIRQRAGIRTM